MESSLHGQRTARSLKSGTQNEASLLKQKLAETTLLLEVLAQVNSLMSQGRNFEDFFVHVAEVLREKLKYSCLHIWLCDEKDPEKLHMVTPDKPNIQRNMSLEEGVIGKAIREGRAICVPDVTFDPDYVLARPETKSELCVPLMYQNRSIGAINIETSTRTDFESHIPILKVIAENLSHSVRLALLYKTEEHFHRLVDHMSEGIWVGDSEEQTLYTNTVLQKMIGANQEELVGKISYEYFHESSQATLRQENIKRRKGKGSHYEAILLGKDAEKISVMLHAVPFGEGGTMATITDLRPLKNAEQQLRSVERYLAAITQYCPEAIVGLDEKGLVQSWNAAAERMFGYKANEIIGKHVTLINPPDRISSGEFQQLLEETKLKGSVRNFETVRVHKNATPMHVSLTFSSLKDDNGKMIGISALYRDITAQKKWERELQDRFEKMQDAYREMGRQRRYMDYLSEMIAMANSSTVTKKQLANFIVNALIMITKVDAVTLRLMDERKEKLILAAQSGLGEDWWSKKVVPYTGSLVETAAERRHSLKILDILSDPRYSSPSLARKNNVRSALIIPLQVKEDIVGGITLYLSQEGNLNLLDDEFISVFAQQAAIALKLTEGN